MLIKKFCLLRTLLFNYVVLSTLSFSLTSFTAASATHRVVIEDETSISIHFPEQSNPEFSQSMNQVKIINHKGAAIAIDKMSVASSEAKIKTAQKLSVHNNYLLHIPGISPTYAKLSQSLINSKYSPVETKLGAQILPNKDVSFKLWSPPATMVKVHLYSKDDQNELIASRTLTKDDSGVWATVISPEEVGLQSLDAYYYQYSVTAYGRTTTALDPYALSMASFSPNSADKVGKGAIIDLNSRRAKPVVFSRTYKNSKHMRTKSDFVGYEMHVRDYTISPDSGVVEELRGTYVGFTKKIDHLKELGISHVQLMPLHNFYTVDENNRSFSGYDNSGINYNWGYDPHNFFTPEGWYSSNADDPYARVRELRYLIKKLHAAKIGVTLDVVYNHTFNKSIFERVCPGCYYRLDENGNISEKTGAGPTVETRNPMVRKLVVDSARLYVKEYGINGFRFDLMGFIDLETMKQVRAAVGPDPVIYGEGWLFSDLPDAQATTKVNLPHNIDIAAFSDGVRDSVSGHFDEGGFVTEDLGRRPGLRTSAIGGLKESLFSQPGVDLSTGPYDRFTESPSESLNYLSIHDGPTQWDKINVSSALKGLDTSLEERLRRSKLAASILFTMQGKTVIHGGIEIARTKPLAANDPSSHRVIPRSTASSTPDYLNIGVDPDIGRHLKFHENSYISADYTNMVRWNRKTTAPYSDLFDYYKKLIYLKRKTPIFQMDNASDVSNKSAFLFQANPQIVVKRIEKDYKGYKEFVLIHNGSRDSQNLKRQDLSPRCWGVILDTHEVNLKGVWDSTVTVKDSSVTVPRLSTAVIGRKC